MLILQRKSGEAIVLEDNVVVRVLEVRGSRVRLAIDAPQRMRVDREEVAVARDEHLADGKYGP